MTYDWIFALVGFAIMFGMLVGIGINQPRGISVKTWCYGYLGIAVGFDLLVVVALVGLPQLVWLTNLLLGLSAGAATGLGFHVAHHISEENEHDHGADEHKQKSMLGF
ncbi:MAG: hypothetical protein NWF05_09555 [Candidatus Bathyarchaeota archaeon]|nr:hypothetical protein [Candidatus Bathyarchaeota archaeon]